MVWSVFIGFGSSGEWLEKNPGQDESLARDKFASLELKL